MKKFSKIILTIFGVGITLCLFAGGISVIGFIVAMCIGGETATEICIFIHKSYFPWVIRVASVSTGLGLIGMYLNKMSALGLNSSNKKKNKGDEDKNTVADENK